MITVRFPVLGFIRQKLRVVWNQLPQLPRALRLIWETAPGLATARLVLLLVQGLIPALSITLTRLLVDQMVIVLKSAPFTNGLPWLILTPALLLAAGIVLLIILTQLLQSLDSWVHTAQTEQVGLKVSMLIQEKASQADYSLFESPEKNDKLFRARVEATYRPVAVMDSLGSLAQGLVTLTAMFTLLVPYGPWPILFLLVGSLPVLFVVVHHKQKQVDWQKSIASQERRAWYYDWLLTAEEGAAELRLFGTAQIFREAYRQIRSRIKNDRLALEQHQLTSQLGASLFGLLAAGICMIYMIGQTLQGQATLGDLVLFYQVISQSQSILRGQLHNAGQFYSSLLFLNQLFEFLDLKNTVLDVAEPEPIDNQPGGVSLCLENISFCYPDSERQVLSGVYLTLPAGKITAIVGDNGAGKSTLLKLICRLYDPQEGRITWNNTDIRNLPQHVLRSQITVLFQTPMDYQATAAENIGYGTNAYQQATPDEIIQAAQGAGADKLIRQLPNGYDTQLGKWFEHGTDLSVGEWQRIALARAFLRKSPLMILDEPTSAMDVWAEMEWLARLRQLSYGSTTLIITHRLTTARQADVIHVMANGQIIESGTHDQLVSQNGRYAQAWLAEMQQGSS